MPFIAAVYFLTRLRVPGVRHPTLDEVANAQAWFAPVGLLIGALLLVLDRLATRALPDASVDVLLVVALAMLTGALHLDGLADAADGLFGAHDPARRLEIMRDVHRGTYAIVAVSSVLALKWAGLAALPTDVRVESILLVPCAARFAMVIGIAAFPYARGEGIGASFHSRAWPLGVVAAGITTFAASILLLGAGGALVAVAAAGVAITFGAYARHLVGGMTGDLYGATVEIAEVAVLLLIAAMANRGWIDALLFG